MNAENFTRKNDWEEALQSTARSFPYPPTPDIAARVQAQLFPSSRSGEQVVPGRGGRGYFPRRPAERAAWRRAALRFAMAVVVLLLALLAVPGVRAALLEFLQIGSVRIFLGAPTAPPPTGTAAPTPTLLPSLLDLSGHTTLEEARSRLDYEIEIPTVPENLGLPDYVFLQEMDKPVLFLAWEHPNRPGRIGLALQKIPQGSYVVDKFDPVTIETTRVNGQPAIWATGPYFLRLKNGDIDVRRLLSGHVLIWQAGEYTYRLETDLSMEEAVKIAESLVVWEASR